MDMLRSEVGSYLRLMDSCISQLKAQGPSRTCNESKEEKREVTFDPSTHLSFLFGRVRALGGLSIEYHIFVRA